jgi:hypothetical protein
MQPSDEFSFIVGLTNIHLEAEHASLALTRKRQILEGGVAVDVGFT